MVRRMRETKNKGFTLVEMIVVLVIMAILSACTVGSYLGYVEKAKTAKLYETASQIKSALLICEAECYAKGELDASAFWNDAFLKQPNHPDSILYPYVGDITGDCTGYTLKMGKEQDGTYRIRGFTYETEQYTVRWERDGEITVTKKQN